MATNKNQHFVPRCYLRAFSVNGEGLALNIFNIDRKRIIANAPLKNQCSKDYFYGEDRALENALQFTEGAYGSVIKKVSSHGYKLTDDHKHFLKLFWLLQYLRTESASRRSVEMFEGVKTTVGGLPDEFVPSIKEAVLHSMHLFVTETHAVRDLKVCLIRNKSNVRFVTSDDPAIMANRWHQLDRRALGMGFGLTSSGMIALLPLSENILFLAYDGDVYSIAAEDGWVICRNSSDAKAFNQFQYFNCRANIFFRDIERGSEVAKSFDDALPHRPKERHKINYAILDATEGNHERYVVVNPEEAKEHTKALIHSQQVFPVPPRWPVQIGWRSKGAVFTNGTGVGYVRRGRAMDGQRHNEFWREKS